MKRLRFLFSLFVAVAAVAVLVGCNKSASFSYEEVKGDPTETRIYTLDNGLKVYMSVNKVEPRIQTAIAVHAGSQDDPAETTGLSHYLEHLMFKGTKQFGTSNYELEKPLLDSIEKLYEHYRTLTDPAERAAVYRVIDSISYVASSYGIPNEYDKLMSAIGSTGTNAYTSFDRTVYIENIPSNQIENWAEIQADRFSNLVIRGFHTELETVYEEKNISMDKDGRRLFDTIMHLLFPEHAYGLQTTLGTQEHLKNPSIVNIKNHYNTYYVPNNMAICISGDFNPDSAIAMINKHFGSLKPNANLPARTVDPLKMHSAPREASVYGTQAEMLYMGWPLPGSADPSNHYIDVISELLSNGQAGLLDVNINQPLKALGVYAQHLDMSDYSALLLGGSPKEGQTLEEVRDLLLEQVARLRSGDFDEAMLQAIINNYRYSEMRSQEGNRGRVNAMLDAFIFNAPWAKQVNSLDEMAQITKQQIVDFANKYLTADSYGIAYKRLGEKVAQEIEKPAITAIKMNRDSVSSFVKKIQANEPAPIEPQFVDFSKDLKEFQLRDGVRVLLSSNPLNSLFSLTYTFDFGTTTSRTLELAASYENYIGSKLMTRQQLNDSLYALAGSYSIGTSTRSASISIYGLNENIEKTVRLVNNHLRNLKVDAEAYKNFADATLKARSDAKLNQNATFSGLMSYATYGSVNPFNTCLSNEEILKMDPQVLVDEMKALLDFNHTVVYYTPDSQAKATEILTAVHPAVNEMKPEPAQLHEFKQLITEKPQVFLADYPSAQVLISQYANQGKTYENSLSPLVSVYNEYFGGSMNSIVFQEMREARALAYSVASSYRTPSRLEDNYTIMTYIGTQADKMNDAIVAFNEILTEMPVSPKAFDVAKEAQVSSIRARRYTNRTIPHLYLSLEKLNLKEDTDKMLFEQIPGITMDDVLAFHAQNIKNNVYHYVVLGDLSKLDQSNLAKLGPVKRLTSQEIFGY